MGEEFGKSGLYIDDLYTLRVIDPEVANETNELKDECERFTESKLRLVWWFTMERGKQTNALFSCRNPSFTQS